MATFSATIPVGTTSTYRVPSLELNGRVQQISIDFHDGNHTYKSSEFDLGIVHSHGGRDLMGQITFNYTYNSKSKTITVCGTDYPSVQGMALITFPEGIEQISIERAATSGYAGDEKDRSTEMNPRSQLMPGLTKILQNIARAANDALIEALIATPSLIVQVATMPPELPAEMYNDLSVVYRKGDLLGAYDPTRQYGRDAVVKPFESEWGGHVFMKKGENFANVIGSTNDPHINSQSWISLWRHEFGNAERCTSYDYNGFECGDHFVGGHVIVGQTAKKVARGSNSVYIYPICAGHNNNDNAYMAALTYLKGVWLKNYLN